MKIIPLLFGLSVIGNVALLGVVVTAHRSAGLDASSDEASADGIASAAASTSGAAVRSADGSGGLSDRKIVALLRSSSPEQVRDALRAVGMSDRLVRSVVSTMIYDRYRDQMEALRSGISPDPERYWRLPSSITSVAKIIERQRLSREIGRETDEVMGGSVDESMSNSRYAFLPEEKRKNLQTIERDYSDLKSEQSMLMNRFALKSDRETLSLLESEKQRDLDEVLTPEEAAAWEKRSSSAAYQVKGLYGSLIETEEEYEAIYALQKAYEEAYPSSSVGRTSEENKARAEAQQVLQEQVAEILGSERGAQLVRQQDPDYRLVQSAVERLGLPDTTFDQVTSIRSRASEASAAIANDSSLTPEQKREAITALAGRLQTELTGVLGEDAIDTFVARSSWMRTLQRGSAYTTGSQRRTLSLPGM